MHNDAVYGPVGGGAGPALPALAHQDLLVQPQLPLPGEPPLGGGGGRGERGAAPPGTGGPAAPPAVPLRSGQAVPREALDVLRTLGHDQFVTMVRCARCARCAHCVRCPWGWTGSRVRAGSPAHPAQPEPNAALPLTQQPPLPSPPCHLPAPTRSSPTFTAGSRGGTRCPSLRTACWTCTRRAALGCLAGRRLTDRGAQGCAPTRASMLGLHTASALLPAWPRAPAAPWAWAHAAPRAPAAGGPARRRDAPPNCVRLAPGRAPPANCRCSGRSWSAARTRA